MADVVVHVPPCRTPTSGRPAGMIAMLAVSCALVLVGVSCGSGSAGDNAAETDVATQDSAAAPTAQPEDGNEAPVSTDGDEAPVSTDESAPEAPEAEAPGIPLTRVGANGDFDATVLPDGLVLVNESIGLGPLGGAVVVKIYALPAPPGSEPGLVADLSGPLITISSGRGPEMTGAFEGYSDLGVGVAELAPEIWLVRSADEDRASLGWQDPSGFLLFVNGSIDISEDELLSIAKGIVAK